MASKKSKTAKVAAPAAAKSQTAKVAAPAAAKSKHANAAAPAASKASAPANTGVLAAVKLRMLTGKQVWDMMHSGGLAVKMVMDKGKAVPLAHVSESDPYLTRQDNSFAKLWNNFPRKVFTPKEHKAMTVTYDDLESKDANTRKIALRKYCQLILENGYCIVHMGKKNFKVLDDMRSTLRTFFSKTPQDEKWALMERFVNKDKFGTPKLDVGYAKVVSSVKFEYYHFAFVGGLDGDDDKKMPIKNFPWPKISKINPNFRKHTLTYYKFLSQFERRRVLDLAEGIGLGRKYLESILDLQPVPYGVWSNADIKFFRYLRPSHQDEDLWGEIHVDLGLFTSIPLSGGGVHPDVPPSPAGLEMFDKKLQEWVLIEKSATYTDIVVFPSDLFRVLTGGYLSGTVHRVLRPMTHDGSERYSLPLITRPRDGVKLETQMNVPYKKLMIKEHIQKFPDWDEYRQEAWGGIWGLKAGCRYIPKPKKAKTKPKK